MIRRTVGPRSTLPKVVANSKQNSAGRNSLVVNLTAKVLCQVVCQRALWHTTPSQCCAKILPLPLAHHSVTTFVIRKSSFVIRHPSFAPPFLPNHVHILGPKENHQRRIIRPQHDRDERPDDPVRARIIEVQQIGRQRLPADFPQHGRQQPAPYRVAPHTRALGTT